MRSGEIFTQLVEFTDGTPDGDISWTLLDETGQPVTTGTVTPADGAVSAVVTISSEDNVLEDGVLASPRELSWVYTAGGLAHTGRQRYRLEAFLPFGVAPDGVRRKLGLETHELNDEDIDLAGAYSQFRDKVGADALATASGMVITDAIEAMAALAILPALQVKLALKQSSGTDQFQRGKIDWPTLRVQLESLVSAGLLTANPILDETANFGSLLVVVVRDDPVTNTAP